MPTGPLHEPTSEAGAILTSTTSALTTVGGADIVMSSFFQNDSGVAHRIYCNTSGTIGIKRLNDAGFTSYTVAAGQYIDGRILAVGSTSDGSSVGMQFIAEV